MPLWITMQPSSLRNGVLRGLVSSSLKKTDSPFGVQSSVVIEPTPKQLMSMEDFLYGFAIHYGMLVKEAQQQNKKPINRELCLKLYCDKIYKQGKLSNHVLVTVSKILSAKGAKTKLSNKQWVSAAMFIYDAWFCLIIGKQHATQNALDIPDSFIQQVDEKSATYWQLSK